MDADTTGTAEDTDDTTVNRSMVDGFIDFLQEYGIIGLAIAVVMGSATKDLVNAVVADVIMPIIAVVLPGEDWRTAVLTVGPVDFGVGHLIGAFLDFLIIAVIVYLIARHIIGRENVGKIG
jgi:large conductance mechanosensitive channel